MRVRGLVEDRACRAPYLPIRSPFCWLASLLTGLRVKRRKRVSRYAVYVLNLRVPPELCDPTLEPTKKTVVLDDEEIVVALVIRIIEEFLRQHQLWCGPAAADGDRPSIVGQNATGYMAEERENLAFDSQHNGTVDGGMSNAAPLSPTLARQLEALARPTPATPPTAPQPATRHSPTGHQRLSNHLTRTPAVLSGGTVNGGGGGMAACSRVIQRRSVSSRPVSYFQCFFLSKSQVFHSGSSCCCYSPP